MPPKASKYQGIIDELIKLGIVKPNSNDEITIKFNSGGILYIRVKNEKVYK